MCGLLPGYFPPVGDLELETDLADVQVPIMLLQYQTVEAYTTLWTSPGASTGELISRVSSALLADDEHFQIIECHPEPLSGVVVLAVVPRWWRRADITPVIVDASAVQRSTALVCIEKDCSYDDLRDAFFDFWPRDAQIVYDQPLQPGDLMWPTERSLFRVIRQGSGIGVVQVLDRALENLSWIRDVAQDGMPKLQAGTGRALVLCPDYAFVLASTAGLTFPQIHRQIAVCVGVPTPHVHVFMPTDTMMRWLTLAGRWPQSWRLMLRWSLTEIPADVDFSLIAVILAEKFHPSSSLVGIEDFVETLELTVARVDGYAHRAGQANKFFFHPNAVATLWVDASDMPMQTSSDEASLHLGDGGEDDSVDGGEDPPHGDEDDHVEWLNDGLDCQWIR